MALSLTLSDLVNAAGALLFVAEGIAVVALARGSRRGLLLGGVLTAYGLTFVVDNLFTLDDLLGNVLRLAAAWPTTVLALLLAREEARRLPTRERRALAALALLGLLATAAFVLVFEAYELRRGGGLARARDAAGVNAVLRFYTFNAVLWLGFGVLLATVACRIRTARDAPERRAMRGVLLAFGIWAAALYCWDLSAGQGAPQLPEFLARAPFWAFMASALCFLVPRARDADPTVARNALLAVVGAGLVAGFLAPTGRELGTQFGLFGIARTIGAGILALAILKHDLLGVPLPRLAMRRGVAATTALAALLIVAQVAQQFLDASYSLLLGSLVAGGSLFVGGPLQRAMDGRDGRVLVPGAPPPRAEDSYRKALRLALRDRVLTREEETHLHELARDLGIDGPRAHELLAEVEAETRVRKEAR